MKWCGVMVLLLFAVVSGGDECGVGDACAKKDGGGSGDGGG